jgi:hypothetical protein
MANFDIEWGQKKNRFCLIYIKTKTVFNLKIII